MALRVQVGVGAFVLNERNQVLVVQEKNGPLKGKGVWKMPTGLLDPAEDVMDGAVREVLEETVSDEARTCQSLDVCSFGGALAYMLSNPLLSGEQVVPSPSKKKKV